MNIKFEDCEVYNREAPGYEVLEYKNKKYVYGFYNVGRPNWYCLYVKKLDSVIWLKRIDKRSGYYLTDDPNNKIEMMYYTPTEEEQLLFNNMEYLYITYIEMMNKLADRDCRE
jgi:hypothetical protein